MFLAGLKNFEHTVVGLGFETVFRKVHAHFPFQFRQSFRFKLLKFVIAIAEAGCSTRIDFVAVSASRGVPEALAQLRVGGFFSLRHNGFG